MVITTSSSSIKSSIRISSAKYWISDLRSSPNFSFTSNNSVLINSKRKCSLPNNSFKEAINFINWSNSSLIFSRSMPVKRCNLNSKIAFAWISEIPHPAVIKASLAASGFGEFLIKRITSSR